MSRKDADILTIEVPREEVEVNIAILRAHLAVSKGEESTDWRVVKLLAKLTAAAKAEGKG